MSRLRSPLLIIGILLSIAVVVALLFAGRLFNPPGHEIPVALQDLPAGTALDSADFHLEEWKGVSSQTLDQYVTADEFLDQYQGALLLEPVRAGFPVAKAQLLVDGAPDPKVSHLATALDEGQALFVLPASPDVVGNFIQPGDTVDMIFSIGAISERDIQNPPPPTPTVPPLGGLVPTPAPTPVVTETLRLPLTKLVLQNIPVLKVERDEPPQQQSVSIPGEESEAPPPPEELGDVQRLYVALDREQLEVVSFLLHNGDVRYAVRARATEEEMTAGITWDDFVDWFFSQRPRPTALPVPPSPQLPAVTPAPETPPEQESSEPDPGQVGEETPTP